MKLIFALVGLLAGSNTVQAAAIDVLLSGLGGPIGGRYHADVEHAAMVAGSRCGAAAMADEADGYATLVNESFGCLSQGSEESPVMISLDSEGNIPVGVIGEANYGFGGVGIGEAGGMLYLNWYNDLGYMWTPRIAGRGLYEVSFDVRIANHQFSMDYINVELWDAVAERSLALKFELIGEDWKTVTFAFDGIMPANVSDKVYFHAYTDHNDALVRNFKIAAKYPNVLVPQALPYTDFAGTSFVANWSEVEGATCYYLTVAEYDYNTHKVSNRYLLKDERVEGCSYLVEGITPGIAYAYYVSASNGAYVTPPSDVILMTRLSTPVITGVKVEDGLIMMQWDEVPGANFYEADLYAKYTAPTDGDFIIADADLSDIESTGTPEKPQSVGALQLNNPPGLLGWSILFPSMIQGGLGIVDIPFYTQYGLYASIDSPYFDLSCAHDVVVEMDMCSGNGSRALICVSEPAGATYAVVDTYVSDALPTEFTTVRCRLHGSQENAFVRVMINNDDPSVTSPNLFIGRIKIMVPMTKGDTSTTLYEYAQAPDITTAEFGYSPVDNIEYYVSVIAVKVDSENRAQLISEPAERTLVIEDAAVSDVTVDSDASEQYFDLMGRRVADMSSPGVYLVRKGITTTKVLVK